MPNRDKLPAAMPSASITEPTASGRWWSTWPTAARSPPTFTTIPAGTRASCWTRKTRNLARQNPADYIEGFYSRSVAGAGRRPAAARLSGPSTSWASAWTRPARRPFRSTATACRWPCGREFAEPSGGPGLALEGPYLARRGGRDHRARPGRTAARLPGQVRRHLQQRMVLVEDLALPAHGAQGLRGGICLGRAGRLRARPFSPAISIPDTLPRGICAAGHKAMYDARWGGLPQQTFLAKLDPALAALAERYATPAVPADDKAGGLTAEVAREGRACRRAWPWPSARSTPTWGRRRGHQAGHAGEDHRHQHLRHDGRPAGPPAARHPRPVRHRARLGAAGHVRPGGGPIGRRRHLQLVRQAPGARRIHGRRRRARALDPRGRNGCGPARAACWPWTGTTATARSWSIRC